MVEDKEDFEFINIEKKDKKIVSTNNINEKQKKYNNDFDIDEKDFEINFIDEINIILSQTINNFIDCFKNLKNKVKY